MNVMSSLPIRRQLFVLLVLAVGFSVLLCGAGMAVFESFSYEPRLKAQLRANATVIAEMVAPAVDFGDETTAARQLGILNQRNDVRASAIYLANGALFAWQPATHGPPRIPEQVPAPQADGVAVDGAIAVLQPIQIEGRSLGTLWLLMETPSLGQRLAKYATLAAVSLLSLICLAVLLSFALRRAITSPIQRLSDAAHAVSEQKDYSVRVHGETGNNEVGRLAAAFNQMLATVESRERENHERQTRLARQTEGMAELVRLEDDAREDIPRALQRFAAIIAKVQQVHRVGIWLTTDNGQRLSCVAGHDGQLNSSASMGDLDLAAASLYAETLRSQTVVNIEDMQSDPRGAELRAVRPEFAGAGAMLDVPVRRRGRIVGVLCHLQMGAPRRWQPEEIRFAEFAADHIALLFEAREAQVAADHLLASEERYRSLIQAAKDAIFTLAPDGRILELNEAVETITGWDRKLWLGRNFVEPLSPEDRDRARAIFAEALAGGRPPSFELRIRAREGGWVDFEFAVSAHYKDGRVVGLLGIGRDLGERKRAAAVQDRLEAQLRQAQKMESIGTLAGGIAHDFNNILTGIMGNTQLAAMDLPAEHPVQELLRGISRSGARARDLVRQILAFSRRSEKKIGPLRIAAVLREALELLRPSLPAHIALVPRIAPDLPPILGDPTLLHQVVLNLVTNAFHAIGEAETGQIELIADEVIVDEAMVAQKPNLRVGRCVRLTVTDTGCGMEAALLERIFEPFFTTKETGKGTGLGLSVVHGIVEEHRGAIVVYSAPGCGSSFQVYFPVTENEGPPDTAGADDATVVAGRGRLLLVDDEEIVLEVARRFLEQAGYAVVAFNDPCTAHREFVAHPAAYDLLLADFTMPGMKGTTLVTLARELRPDLPVLLMSGFMGDLGGHRLEELGVQEVIGKPFTCYQLTAAVRRALDASMFARLRRTDSR